MQLIGNVSERNSILLRDEITDLNSWLQVLIDTKILQCKENFKKKWLPFLESDPEIDSYPKNFDKFMDLVISRPYYRSREDEERISKMNKSSQFTIK